MAVNLSPVFNDAQLDSSGNPFSGAKLFTYAAGSSNKQTTYKDSGGNTAHDNPILLNSRGEPPSPIWLTAGQAYKFRLCLATESDPPSASIRDIDNVSGVNDTTVTADQWAASGLTPTHVSATQFTLSGDQTTDFHVGRRVKVTDAGGTKVGYITASAYTTLTTVTVLVDSSGSLESPTSNVSLGIQTTDSPSEPLLTDDYPLRSDATDKTKKVRLDLSGITTATTRTLTVQDSDDTLVGRDTTDTLTNKTLTSPTITTGTLNGAVAGTSLATQAEQETGTATDKIVTPGRQHFHPSAVKAWVVVDVAAAIQASYNVTSVTDVGAGIAEANWATDFSGAAYVPFGNAIFTPNATPAGSRVMHINNPLAVGSTRFTVINLSTFAATDPNFFSIGALGDHS